MKKRLLRSNNKNNKQHVILNLFQDLISERPCDPARPKDGGIWHSTRLVFSSHVAFTLAEVLITLGIIGVVAALTIPTLMNKTNEKELITAWKKQFSVINQATMMIMNDNSGALDGVFTSSEQMKDVYKSYLRYSRDCNAIDNCVYSFRYLNGTQENSPDKVALFLNDGALLEFWLSDSNCATIEGSSTVINCGGITIDVNGPKKPNVVGKDIFGVFIQKNRVLPEGAEGFAGAYAGCDNTSYGWGCSAKYLLNN